MDFLLLFLSVFASDPVPIPDRDRTVPPVVERPGPTSQPLACELRQSRNGNGRVIVAMIRAKAQVEGSFELKIGKQDARRNTVNADQDGDFSIRAGETQSLADTALNVGRGDTVVGRLELRDNHGNPLASCDL